MNVNAKPQLDFAKVIPKLACEELWEYATSPNSACKDLKDAAYQSLQQPTDFPPMAAAIVSGDRVALAVDPNIPQLAEVLQGVLKAVKETEASEIDIVLGDEAGDATLLEIRACSGEGVQVIRHDPSNREALRYLGADKMADPIYLNRRLVDADFVIPILAERPDDHSSLIDRTGIFPFFSDAASRIRYYQPSQEDAETVSDPSEPAWLLGVQIMMSVGSNKDGNVGTVTSGTPDAIRKQLKSSRRPPDEFPPPASLVIASLDGNSQQQTWQNAARALQAATRYSDSGGTIVLWTAIEQEPFGSLLLLSDRERRPEHPIQPDTEGDFPDWDPFVNPAKTIAELGEEHRILVHSRISRDTIESLGIGSLENADELAKLVQSFETCGVLRAAQFAGNATDAVPRTV